jgi:hypothetical protein
MPDPQTPDRTDTSPADPSSALKELPSWQQELGSTLWKWLTGGATLGSLVTLLSTTELPKVALGAAAGGALSGAGAIAAAFANPVRARVKKGAEVLGTAAADAAEDAAKQRWINQPFEEKYWYCQAKACSEAKAIGIPQYDGIFIPLLEEVFVELGLDANAQLAGLQGADRRALQQLSSEINGEGDRLQIWDLLSRADRQPQFRRMALIAWGGYGKTTLMRHVAYVYSKGLHSKDHQRRGLKRKLPVLLILGRHREVLSGQAPPDLAALIEQQHIPHLPITFSAIRYLAPWLTPCQDWDPGFSLGFFLLFRVETRWL